MTSEQRRIKDKLDELREQYRNARNEEQREKIEKKIDQLITRSRFVDEPVNQYEWDD